ncbi:MAG: hypothetical protein AAGJ40_09075 [Planctomycetota bacterium]
MTAIVETAAWLEALYGRCNPDHGNIVLSPKSKRRTVGTFSVGDSRQLLAAAEAMSGKSDHYIKINLMDAQAMRERARKGGNHDFIVGNLDEVKTVVSFHLDADAGKSSKYHSRGEMLECLNAMPRPPSLIVNSDGVDGGFHTYWIFEEPISVIEAGQRSQIASLSKRWQTRLSELAGGRLDTTGDLTRFLRVVGQPRANGNVVSCHEYHRDRLYSLADLTIPPSIKEVVRASRAAASKRIAAAIGPPPIQGDVHQQAAAYVARMEPSISGHGGHNKCFAAACALVKGFRLGEHDAKRILEVEFNPRCDPEWSDKELDHKVRQAMSRDGAVGYLLRRPAR